MNKNLRTTLRRVSMAGIGALAVYGIVTFGFEGSDSQAANTIPLAGVAGLVCTINVTPDVNSTNLPITSGGLQHVTVGTVLQTCNKFAGYTLDITSANCATGTAGGKLVELVSSNAIAYSAGSTNPTTGGSSANVSGLLAGACTAQTARNVIGATVTGETSTISVDFTGNAVLFPGTYADTLTITMNVK